MDSKNAIVVKEERSHHPNWNTKTRMQEALYWLETVREDVDGTDFVFCEKLDAMMASLRDRIAWPATQK